MNVHPLISIILPAYNVERFIAESIQSVIDQTYFNWELIIVDDGSTDKTKQIIQFFLDKDDRITYVHQENGKQGKARNTGIKIARGNFIAFLDADDKWMLYKLEKQLQHMNDTNADIVFADAVIIDENSQQLKDTWGVRTSIYMGDKGLIAFLGSNRMPLLTVFAKKESILRANGFKELSTLQYGEDYDLWIRMLQQNMVFAGFEDKLGFYRMHKTQSTINKLPMLQEIPTINSISITDKELLKEKNRLLKLRIRKFIKVCSPRISAMQLEQIISLFPSYAERFFFSMLNRFINERLLSKVILLHCRNAVHNRHK